MAGICLSLYFGGYLSNRPQVSMVYRLINHAECSQNTRRICKSQANWPISLLLRHMHTTKGKKNNRGARGSTQEEISASKCPNMATDNSQSQEELEVEEAAEVDTTNEPNLYDIHA